MGEQETCRIGVSCAGCIYGLRGISLDEMDVLTAAYPAAILTDLDDCHLAHTGYLVKSLARIVKLGESLGLGLIGKDYIYIPFYYVVQESEVRLHYIIGSHIDGDDASGLVGKLHSTTGKSLVLNQIPFNMEIIIAFEKLRLQVFRHQVQGGSQIDGESPLGIASAHEDHRAAARVGTLQKGGLHSVLLLVALEQKPQLVVANLADEARRHPEYGCAGYGVGRRSAGYIFDSQRFERRPYFISRLHVHVLHAPFRKMILAQQAIVGQHCKYVGEGISYAKNTFHCFQY